MTVNICKLLLATLVLGFGGYCVAPSSYAAETYRGTVIDAETKAPLEGAVVVVIWYSKPLITMDGPQYFHKATEALTDAEGKFTVDGSPGMNWNPFRRVLKDPKIYPKIIIFNPSYGPFPTANLSSISEENSYSEGVHKANALMGAFSEGIVKDGAVVELTRLKTADALKRYKDSDDVGFSVCHSASRFHCVPPDQISNFLRLINAHRQAIGLDPLRGESTGGQRQ
jgi:hypothetical protein